MCNNLPSTSNLFTNGNQAEMTYGTLYAYTLCPLKTGTGHQVPKAGVHA